MEAFVTPEESLSRVYAQACTEFTWEKVRTSLGVKVKPKTRKQTGPTCIYEAIVAWLESHLRLHGIVVSLSSDDLREKEQNYNGDELDRTIRCILVSRITGVCSEEDYRTKNPNGILYKAGGCKFYYKLHYEATRGALESMHEGPLLVVFHCGENYKEYVFRFKEEPVLSYERYREGVMAVHAVNSLGYGVENVVPWWRYMNSYGKKLNRGIGRVLPQNCIHVVGMVDGVRIQRPKRRKPADEEACVDEEEKYAGPPPLKKTRVEIGDPMEVDEDLMEIDP